jgi:hypothetical protein
MNTKPHAVTDAEGRPLRYDRRPGQHCRSGSPSSLPAGGVGCQASAMTPTGSDALKDKG